MTPDSAAQDPSSESTTTSESENTSGADADTEESITSEEEPAAADSKQGAEKWVAVKAQQTSPPQPELQAEEATASAPATA